VRRKKGKLRLRRKEAVWEAWRGYVLEIQVFLGQRGDLGGSQLLASILRNLGKSLVQLYPPIKKGEKSGCWENRSSILETTGILQKR